MGFNVAENLRASRRCAVKDPAPSGFGCFGAVLRRASLKPGAECKNDRQTRCKLAYEKMDSQGNASQLLWKGSYVQSQKAR